MFLAEHCHFPGHGSTTSPSPPEHTLGFTGCWLGHYISCSRYTRPKGDWVTGFQHLHPKHEPAVLFLPHYACCVLRPCLAFQLVRCCATQIQELFQPISFAPHRVSVTLLDCRPFLVTSCFSHNMTFTIDGICIDYIQRTLEKQNTRILIKTREYISYHKSPDHFSVERMNLTTSSSDMSMPSVVISA